MLVFVNPALQWTHTYCPLGASLIFESYFLLMNALHVDWLSRRHQFSTIPASDAAARMVLPTCIILASPLPILLFTDSVCQTYSVEVCQNMSPGDGNFPHSLVGDPVMRLHEASFTFTNTLRSPPPGGLLEDFSCFSFLNTSASSLSLV